MEVSKRHSHDAYGKRVLARLPGFSVKLSGPDLEVRYGTPYPARLDAVCGDIAIELESRTAKQIRGAAIDLITHPFPKKLMILIPMHMADPEVAAAHCRFLFDRFAPGTPARVIVLKGTAIDPREEIDAEAVAGAIRELISTPLNAGP